MNDKFGLISEFSALSTTTFLWENSIVPLIYICKSMVNSPEHFHLYSAKWYVNRCKFPLLITVVPMCFCLSLSFVRIFRFLRLTVLYMAMSDFICNVRNAAHAYDSHFDSSSFADTNMNRRSSQRPTRWEICEKTEKSWVYLVIFSIGRTKVQGKRFGCRRGRRWLCWL